MACAPLPCGCNRPWRGPLGPPKDLEVAPTPPGAQMLLVGGWERLVKRSVLPIISSWFFSSWYPLGLPHDDATLSKYDRPSFANTISHYSPSSLWSSTSIVNILDHHHFHHQPKTETLVKRHWSTKLDFGSNISWYDGIDPPWQLLSSHRHGVSLTQPAARLCLRRKLLNLPEDVGA